MKMDLNEARKKLEAVLDDTQRKEYFSLLRQWFLFRSSCSKEQFNQNVCKLLVTNEQIACHNNFLFAILSERNTSNKPKSVRTSHDKSGFEYADFSEYVQPCSPGNVLPPSCEYRTAASELFIPDSGFVACRIAITAWENGMEGADSSVTETIVHLCQTFLKSIITAMITKMKSYKIRDGKFQYGFNIPVPDPFTRNSNNILDDSSETSVEFDKDILVPRCRMSLERAEQQMAHAYAASKKKRYDNTLSVKLLYETLKNNPKLLGLHSMHSVNLLKLGLHLSEDDEDEDNFIAEDDT